MDGRGGRGRTGRDVHGRDGRMISRRDRIFLSNALCILAQCRRTRPSLNGAEPMRPVAAQDCTSSPAMTENHSLDWFPAAGMQRMRPFSAYCCTGSTSRAPEPVRRELSCQSESCQLTCNLPLIDQNPRFVRARSRPYRRIFGRPVPHFSAFFVLFLMRTFPKPKKCEKVIKKQIFRIFLNSLM